MEGTRWPKLSSESIKIPSKVSFVLVVSEASPTNTSVGVLKLKSKCIFQDWLEDDYTGTSEKVF